jgi:tripeptidyl-peptidase-1
MVLGTGYPVKTTFTHTNDYYVWGPVSPDKPSQKKLQHDEDDYLTFLHTLAHNETMPSVTTSSEALSEPSLSSRYQQYLCQKYAQIGARGVSIMFPSDDYGSGGPLSYKPGQIKKVVPTFPNSCPFVTSVGATIYTLSGELASTCDASVGQGQFGFPSGGGFSTVFTAPDYQKSVISAYIKSQSLNRKFKNVHGYNPSGRGIPDVAAFGQKIPNVYGGKMERSSGTSASCPIVAALIATLNSYEASNGRPPLGFVNPWLYSRPDVLDDITQGGLNDPFFCPNKSESSCQRSGVGYPTSKGWDAVTGLGTLNVGKMIQALDEMAVAGALGAA